MELGAVSVMLYCFRERELLLNINELIGGFRMFPSYIRVGGLREDLPDGLPRGRAGVPRPVAGQAGRVRGPADARTRSSSSAPRGVGVISQRRRARHGAGRADRARGRFDYDVRKAFPYSGYETFDFDVPVGAEGDVYARYLVRIAEMRESCRSAGRRSSAITPTGAWAVDDPRVVPPPKDKVYTEMEALIQHFLIYSQGFTVPAGEAYVPIEGPRGEHGFYVVSDGTNRPWRVKMRSPSLLACQALPKMIVGGLIADVIAVIGSIDVVMGDVDR